MIEVLDSPNDRLREVANRTPVVSSRTLDARLDAKVFVKCENLQRVGAFKFRGAYHALSRLDDAAAVFFSGGDQLRITGHIGDTHGVGHSLEEARELSPELDEFAKHAKVIHVDVDPA